MILRSIAVDGIACFADRFEINDLSDGLNIIYGPNGAGKSTLMTAIARALFDSHRVGGARIKELVPWGRKLSPTVALRFEHEANRYRIEKTFVTEAAATLSRWEDGRYVSLARGADADNMVREMMQATAPSRGASDVSNWGISQILFAPQHRMALPELSGNIAQRIRQSFTEQVTGDQGSDIADRIAAEYNIVFTTAGKYKTGKNAPPLADLTSQRDTLIARRDELVDLLATYERCSGDIVDLEETVKLHERQLESIDAQRRQAVGQADRYRELITKRDQEAANVEAVEGKFKLLTQQIEQLSKERTEAAQCAKRIDQLKQQQEINDADVKHRSEALKKSCSSLAELEKRKTEIIEQTNKSEAASRLTGEKQNIQRLDRDLERIETAVDQRDSARRRRSETVDPTANEIRAIRAAMRDLDMPPRETSGCRAVRRSNLRSKASVDSKLPARPFQSKSFAKNVDESKAILLG